MKKISITFNGYEYLYLKYARDIINENAFANADIKDVIYSFIIYTKEKVKDKRSLTRFVNIFLIKSNNKPLEEDNDESEAISFGKIKGVYFKVRRDPQLGKIYSFPILYVLRLSDEILEYLDIIKGDILSKAPQLKEPNYSEIIRNCVHFVIDHLNSKLDFFSTLYMVQAIPSFNVINIMKSLMDIDKNRKINLDDLFESIKEKDLSENCRKFISDFNTYKKLKKWLEVSKLNETAEEFAKIQEKIGSYSTGYIVPSHFVSFIFFLTKLYSGLEEDTILLVHFYYERIVNSLLEYAKELYINKMDEIFIYLLSNCLS